MRENICMIAHRGYSGKFHQNTEKAFLEAAKNGSGGAETDVRMTKDGVFVCSHDAQAVFEDDTALTVSDATFAELTAKPLKQNKTDDKYYLCTFRRYLEIMRDNGMICFIELKGEYTDGQVKQIFDLAAEVYDLKKCILQSFSFDNLLKARELFPDLPLMLTYGTREKNYERCFEYGFSIDADICITTKKMVEDFHREGLEVGVWTANTGDDLRLARALNVDYIESDFFGGEK